jgi:meiotic recombination protein SPO11
MADEVAQLVGESSAQTNSNPETKVRHFIQTVLVSILDELSKTDGRPTVTIARRSTGAMHFLNQETGALESRRREPVLCSYSWPGSTVQEAWRFGMTSCANVPFVQKYTHRSSAC